MSRCRMLRALAQTPWISWLQMASLCPIPFRSLAGSVSHTQLLYVHTHTNTPKDAKPIKDRLSSSFGVDFSRSWTTSTLITNKGTVSPWNCGAMITKPLTTRRYGKIWKGCIGSLRQIGTFMADDRGTGSYNGVQWISGAVGWCEKRQNNPPLSRCSGSGNFR